GEKIPIEHGGGLHHWLRERHRRQLDRKPARLQDAAPYVLRPRAQVSVAGVDVTPRVDDTDDRLAAPILRIVAELAQPRAMAERTQVVDAEPAMAAEFFRTFMRHGGGRS